MAPSNFHITSAHPRLHWSRDTPPLITVPPGATVTFDLKDSSGGQVNPSTTPSDLAKLDLATFDPIFGPVAIEGAEPGDVLEIEFLHLQPSSGWGFTAIFPGFGLLADEFPNHVIKHFTWDQSSPTTTTTTITSSNHILFQPGIKIPLRPFLGVAGVAPSLPGPLSTIPPLDTGGNIDCKHITAGTRLYLPVRVPGANFSCGDGHAAQGDGEVCGTAIETPMKATLRFTVRKDMPYVTSPHYDTRGSAAQHAQHQHQTQGGDPPVAVYAVLGIDSDLLEASRKALRGLIARLVATRGLEREEAYMLCSIAADLKIAEIVDMPNFAVSASIPYSIFED
ncbi:formamidase [Colletotrichum orchidophilum]|uniref:Formamidase n=1 Tax=Colletotrichum orchidophilum TaxID=1209926 RepID=A0A1G4ANG6_9PEZI|nr:formamidase [Colletotrichum orchidophilum]OHE90714.1 formamidase [Colletotrichum orchidophilum]